MSPLPAEQLDIAAILRECAAEERERPSSGPLTATGMDMAADEIERLEGIIQQQAVKLFDLPEIERIRAAINQVHHARLTWAMVCECTCKPCDEFYEFVRDTLPDCSPADVQGESRG